MEKKVKAVVIIATFATGVYALYKEWPKVIAAVNTLFE